MRLNWPSFEGKDEAVCRIAAVFDIPAMDRRYADTAAYTLLFESKTVDHAKGGDRTLILSERHGNQGLVVDVTASRAVKITCHHEKERLDVEWKENGNRDEVPPEKVPTPSDLTVFVHVPADARGNSEASWKQFFFTREGGRTVEDRRKDPVDVSETAVQARIGTNNMARLKEITQAPAPSAELADEQLTMQALEPWRVQNVNKEPSPSR